MLDTVRPIAPTRPPGRRLGLLLLLPLLWLGACSSLPTRPDDAAPPPTQACASTPAAAQVPAGDERHSGFALLDNPAQALATRLALIHTAAHSLDIQYYAIHADGSTDVLLAALHAAAARGVRVRLLLDDFNTTGPQAQVLWLGFEPGIELRLFHPLPGPRHSTGLRVLRSLGEIDRIQRRMHNKLMVADGRLAIIGGRNLGDSYFDPAADGAFVDMDMLAAGQAVQDMAHSFERYWNHALARPAESVVTPQDLRLLRSLNPARAHLPQASPTQPPEPSPDVLQRAMSRLVWAPATVLTDGPDKLLVPTPVLEHAGCSVIDRLLQHLQGARHEVLIVTPYLVPGVRIHDALAHLVRKGVRVRILTNSLASTDAPVAHVGYARHRQALLATGIELFEMQARQTAGLPWSQASRDARTKLHTKPMVVDGQWLAMGSMNLDLRSQLQNTENALWVNSPALARQALLRVETTLAAQAYEVRLRQGQLHWRPPGEQTGQELRAEPQASTALQWLVRLLAPFTPDDML